MHHLSEHKDTCCFLHGRCLNHCIVMPDYLSDVKLSNSGLCQMCYLKALFTLEYFQRIQRLTSSRIFALYVSVYYPKRARYVFPIFCITMNYLFVSGQ